MEEEVTVFWFPWVRRRPHRDAENRKDRIDVQYSEEGRMLETFSSNGEMVISTAAYLENRSSGLVGSQEVLPDRQVQHGSHSTIGHE